MNLMHFHFPVSYVGNGQQKSALRGESCGVGFLHYYTPLVTGQNQRANFCLFCEVCVLYGEVLFPNPESCKAAAVLLVSAKAAL
jgi:hypothetical protein